MYIHIYTYVIKCICIYIYICIYVWHMCRWHYTWLSDSINLRNFSFSLARPLPSPPHSITIINPPHQSYRFNHHAFITRGTGSERARVMSLASLTSRNSLSLSCSTHMACCSTHIAHVERWGAGVETQKNVRGEIEGWGRVPFNEPYAPSLITICDGA